MHAPGSALQQTYRIDRLDASTPVEQFQQLAKLHIASIHGGILEALGPRFLTALYQQLSKGNDVLMYAARCDSETVGFIAGSFNMMDSVKNIGIVGMGRLALAGCANVWRPHLLRKVLQTAGYFFRRTDAVTTSLTSEEASAPGRAELLAIAVAANVRGQGIGKLLVEALELGFRNRSGPGRYFVSTNQDEIGSNAFYQAAGFILVGQRPHHDLTLNVYRKDLKQ